MKWLKAVVGLIALGGFAYGVWYVREMRIEVPFIGELERPIELKEGVEVPLILLTPLDSGGSEEGKSIQMVVSENVKAGGKIVIRQGAIATGKVVRSRAGTLLGALTNIPARLEIELQEVKAVDGKTIKLRSLAVGEPFAFDQANTKPEEKPNAKDAVSDPNARELVAGMAKQIATGQQMSDQDKSKADAQLKDLAGRYGLENTTAFLKGSKPEQKKDVAGLLESVQKGDLTGLSGMNLLLAVKAAGEIVDLGSGIDKSLRSIFKGNNIHAPVGTPVKAYVAEKGVVNGK